MNSFRAMIKDSSFDNADVARLLGLDVATVILFDLKVGFINIDAALSICGLLDVSFYDMFPSLEDLAPTLDEEADLSDEIPSIYSLFEQPEYHPRLLGCGLDPEVQPWYVVVQLKTGVERRYRLSSIEKHRLDHALQTAKDTKGHFVFHADCQTIILDRSAVQDVRFSRSLSYAQFSSEERGFAASLVLPHMHFAAVTLLRPDDMDDEEYGSPLHTLINLARAGEPLPPFVRLPEDGELRFLQIENFEVFEIPVALTIPNFYQDGDEEEGPAETLLMMETLGSA